MDKTTENAETTTADEAREKRTPSRWRKPLLLYAATWATTTFVGFVFYGGGSWLGAALFSVPLMIILTAHELGHYWQTRRYDIPSSPPFFIPFPLPPFGTLGALIRMSGRVPNAKALFDVGVSGPLAGFAATLVFLAIGLANSTLVDARPATGETLVFGEPLLFRWASLLFFDRSDPTQVLTMHPTAAAAWVGLFLTTLNLFPMGQLDGGHVLYALLRRRAVYFSTALFIAAAGAVFLFERWNWLVMLFLIAFFGLEHPPTADDSTRLGPLRTAIGWGTLALVAIGFTPNPVDVESVAPDSEKSVFFRNEPSERAAVADLGARSGNFGNERSEQRKS
ncbi:MAG: site-2 protease family protein [Thermoguttaceae bacterium]|nr:site-2 protease family protein [Thermoguttaceae bacterium]